MRAVSLSRAIRNSISPDAKGDLQRSGPFRPHCNFGRSIHQGRNDNGQLPISINNRRDGRWLGRRVGGDGGRFTTIRDSHAFAAGWLARATTRCRRRGAARLCRTTTLAGRRSLGRRATSLGLHMTAIRARTGRLQRRQNRQRQNRQAQDEPASSSAVAQQVHASIFAGPGKGSREKRDGFAS